MKNLLAAVSYSFNNFYGNLNEQGKLVFSVIVFLIVLLSLLLFVTYIIQGIQSRVKISIINKQKSKKVEDNSLKNVTNSLTKKENPEPKVAELKTNSKKEKQGVSEKTEIMDIAESIEKALKEETPITLTSFEEDQERTAIISIDELMSRAKDLDLVEDEEFTGVNYLEKYNLEPSEVKEMVDQTTNNKTSEVKAFKVSQVISPVYGVKKEVINDGK